MNEFRVIGSLRRIMAAALAFGLAGATILTTASPGGAATTGTTTVHSDSVHSAAGGQGWTGLQLQSDAFLDGISCPSSSVCYSVGGRFNNDSIVEKTANAGASWTGMTIAATGSIGTFDAVSCPDATHCMATGGGDAVGTAYRTVDGVQWTSAALPSGTPELSGVSCVSDSTCFAVSFKGEGVQTTNFGDSWQPLDYQLTNAGAAAVDNFNILFQSPLVGWVVGRDASCTSTSCAGRIQETTDGGNTWAYSPTPAGMPPILSIACPGANYCVAIGSSSTGLAAFRTSDGGSSWSASTGPSHAFPDGSVSCPDQNDCFAGGSENVIRTSTGGLVDATAVMFQSTDGGATWKLQEITGGLSFIDAVSCTSTLVWIGAGGTPANAAVAATTDGGAPPGPGYYLVASDGGIFSYGTARFHGSTGNVRLAKPVVGMAVTASGNGYWLVASDGGIFAFGDARFFGSTGNVQLARPIVGMAIDPVTGGYWMVASDGGIFSFHAPFLGSMGGKAISAPIIGMKAMADGSGYYLLAADGTAYAFGSAALQTCRGAAPIPHPVAAMATDRVDGGFWTVNLNGALASCQNPPFFGDLSGVRLNRPVVGMSATPDARGYWFVATDGGIFSFGDARFLGSTGGITLARPVVGMATLPST